eukprot:gnl/TRDRNA2_/TRDRNA2_80482_c2_seq1.p2 gnl/TRDRNA2_/TRDRNA2_80482_c2~~gnl/TRDRNA2_/TRDRNA2_80482_c2_seq1.p2  ORF type:complete len:148 (-),score=36.08 gnl/TRDRNA2_/TRDRNA2_80482_c2_seq1:82-525(-)
MAVVESGMVVIVTGVYAVCVFGGGLYGYISAGSKISAIASGICALVAWVLTDFQATITPWPAAAWCLLLTGMFGKKAFAKKKEESMCPVHGEAPEMTGDKASDPMAKYTRMEEGASKPKDDSLAKPIMTVLTIFSLVEVALLVQLAL